MDRSAAEPAEVFDSGARLDLDARRAACIDIDPATLETVEAMPDAARDAIAAHYHLSLGSREGAGFLRDDPGGFYRRHRDQAVGAARPGAARRLVSPIVFLNSSRSQPVPGEFSGGELHRIARGEIHFRVDWRLLQDHGVPITHSGGGHGTVQERRSDQPRRALGVEGLVTGSPPGPAPTLNTAQRDELTTLLESGSSAAGDTSGVWTGPMIGDLIAQRVGARYHNHHVPRKVHGLGFSVQRPRRRLARADAEAQAVWLRETLPRMKTSRRLPRRRHVRG